MVTFLPWNKISRTLTSARQENHFGKNVPNLLRESQTQLYFSSLLVPSQEVVKSIILTLAIPSKIWVNYLIPETRKKYSHMSEMCVVNGFKVTFLFLEIEGKNSDISNSSFENAVFSRLGLLLLLYIDGNLLAPKHIGIESSFNSITFKRYVFHLHVFRKQGAQTEQPAFCDPLEWSSKL